MIDANELLVPVPGGSPCGPDLEDDNISADNPTARSQQAAFYNLDALYSEARRADAEDAVWTTVLHHATDVLKFNKHLRIAFYLCDAAMRRQQLAGLASSLGVIRKFCETWWVDVHPLASVPGGKQARVNVLSGLGGNSFLAALRGMPFVERVSGATLKAYEATAEAAGSEDTAAREFARSVLGAEPAEKLAESLRLVNEAADHIQWISSRVDLEYSPDGDVDCGEFLSGVEGKLVQKIESIRRILQHATGAPATAATGGAQSATAPATSGAAADPGPFTKSRIRPMLDQIIEYYRVNEPSSPVPLLLMRAKRMMDLSFMDLVNDTAGDEAMRKAQQILGTGKEGV